MCARQAIREWFQNGSFWLQYVEIYASNRFYLTVFKSSILIMHSINKIQTFVKIYSYFNCLILLWSSNCSMYSYIYIVTYICYIYRTQSQLYFNRTRGLRRLKKLFSLKFNSELNSEKSHISIMTLSSSDMFLKLKFSNDRETLFGQSWRVGHDRIKIRVKIYSNLTLDLRTFLIYLSIRAPVKLTDKRKYAFSIKNRFLQIKSELNNIGLDV